MSIRGSFLFLFLLSLFQSFAQNSKVSQSHSWWTAKDPFEQNVFIENSGGQFNLSGKYERVGNKNKIIGNNILFSTRILGVDIYFSSTGLVYRYDKLKKPTEKKRKESKGKMDNENDELPQLQSYFFSMEWEGANSATEIIPEDEVKAYYSYWDGKQTIIAHAFKKILYKNIYQGIDIEYSFHEGKKGLEYSIIVHPKADLRKVRLLYKDAKSILENESGNIEVASSFGKFVDNSPIKTYYLEDSSNVKCSFILKGKKASFTCGIYNTDKTLIIDPWIKNPGFLNYNSAYDVDYDNRGNVYAYGGFANFRNHFQEVKYNSNGVLQWTFNTTAFLPNPYYGDIAVDKGTGTSYLLGAQLHGMSALKVNTLGLILDTLPGTDSLNEMWRAVYNPCGDNIIIGAGGTAKGNQACVLDTNMDSILPVNILGTYDVCHDVCLIALDPSGKHCYMAVALSTSNSTIDNNVVMQLPIPLLIPYSYKVSDGYSFTELGSISYVEGSIGFANGMNGMAASPNWLYMYDGATLKQRNKNTGALNDSIRISNTSFAWGGLAVDPCDKVFVGCRDSIKIYNSGLAFDTSIAVSDTVYDIALGQNNLIYACGAGFVSSLNVPNPSKLLFANINTPSSCSACDGIASVIVNCGIAPFSFQWSNGETGQKDTLLCSGTYTVIVADASCPPRLDTLIVNVPIGNFLPLKIQSPYDSLCLGSNDSILVSGAKNYSWSPAIGLSCITCPNPIASPTATTTYTVTGTDTIGCVGKDSVTITVFSLPNLVAIPPKDSICKGDTVKLSIKGAFTYSWNPSTSLSCNTCPNPTGTPNTTTTYTIIGTNSNGCKDSTNIIITVSPVPSAAITSPKTICMGDSITLSASGGGTYHWSNGSKDSIIIVYPISTTNYSVTITKLCNVTASTSVTVITPLLFACCDTSIHEGDTVILSASGSVNYRWTPSTGLNCDTCPAVIANPAMTTTYTIIGTDSGGCQIERLLTVIVENPCTDFTIPNVFTPNGDNRNDYFEIKTENLDKYSIFIYDRWGKEMYKSTDPTKYWNGSTETGTEAPDGVYYYIINSICQGDNYSKQGFVQVIR